MHKAYLGQKQFSIEGLDMTVPMLDELIRLAGRARRRARSSIGMAHRGRLNVLAHNLGRPYEHDLRRVRGRLDARRGHHDPAGRHRRRQVPPRRAGHLRAARRRVAARAAWSPTRRTSSSSRPVVDRRHARRADHAPGPARPPRHRRRRPDRPARRRRLPRPGRRRGVAEPPGARRLPGRRHGPPDPEQPGRLHDRPRGRALHALGLGPGQGLRRRRSSTSTPTTWRPASPPCGSPSPTARSSATTSSST